MRTLLLILLLVPMMSIGQSKKEQIANLNKRINSLNDSLSTTKEKLSSSTEEIKVLKSEITTLKIDKKTSLSVLTNLEKESDKLKIDFGRCLMRLEELSKKNRLLEGISNLSPFYIYCVDDLWEVPDEIQNASFINKPPVNVSGLCLELLYCPYIEGVRFNLGRYENGKKQGEWISNSPNYTYAFDETDYYTPLNESPLDNYTAYAVMAYKDDNLVKTSYTNKEFKEFAYSIRDSLGKVTFYHSNSTLLFESNRDKVFHNNGNIAREKNLDNGNFIFYNRDGSVNIEEPGDIFEIGMWGNSWPCQ